MKYATKTNNKTLLLAVVAVLAMIAAAFAIASYSENVDAAEQDVPAAGEDVIYIEEAAATVVDGKSYVIAGEGTTYTLSAAAAVTVTALYVPEGATVLINNNITITKLYSVYDEGAHYDDAKYLGGVKTGAATTSKITIVMDEGETATIAGIAAQNVTIEAFTLTVPEKETFAYTLTPYAVPTLAGAYKYDAANTLMTVFGSKAQPDSIALAGGDYFKPAAGGVVVSTGANTVAVNDYVNTLGKTSKYTGTLVFDAVAGENVDLNVTGDITKGELAMVLGKLTFAAAPAANTALNVNDVHIITGIATAATISADHLSIYADINRDIIVAESDPDMAYVLGDYWFPNKSTKLDVDVTVAANTRLTIAAIQSVDVGVNKSADADDVARTLTVTGTVDVWGKLTGVTGKNSAVAPANVIPTIAGAGSLTIRADAQVTGFINAAGASTIPVGITQEIPASDDYPGISGVLDKDAEYANFEIPEGKTLTIPEGVTLTVTDMMALNGQTVIVNGTLVIADGAQVGGKGAANAAANAILLGAKGKITGDGDVAKYTPVFVGKEGSGITVLGVEGITAAMSKGQIAFSGAASPIDKANYSSILIENAVINGAMLIDEGVYATLAGDSTISKGIFAVAGSLELVTFDLTMKEGTSLVVTGVITTAAADSGVIVTETTVLGTDLEKGADLNPANFATIMPTKSTDTATNVHWPTGYSITVAKSTYVDEETEDEMFYQRAYIAGTLAFTGTLGNEVTLDTAGGLTITKAVFIAALDEFKQTNAKMALITTGAGNYVVVEGQLTSVGFDLPDVVGAAYSIASGEPEVTTYYAVDANTGLFGVIDTYKNKTVTLYGDANYPVDLAADLTITDKQIVASNGVGFLTIPEGTVLAVMAGGSFDGAAIFGLEGKVIVFKDGSCDLNPLLYQVYYEDDDGDATYCGLDTALAEAEAGDTITVANNVPARPSLVIPAGVTVVISTGKTLTITKAITVNLGAELEVNGYLVFGTEETKNAKITVLGTMDISAAQNVNLVNYDGDAKYAMQIVSEGEFIYTAGIPAGIVLVGVTYQDGTKTVLTSIENAVETGKDITISGTYETDDLVELGTSKLTINGAAKIATIDLDGGSVVVDGANAKLDATIVGIDGEDGVASLTVEGFKGTIDNKATAGVYTLSINGFTEGSVAIIAGSVTLKEDATVNALETLIVADGAELVISDLDIDIENNGSVAIAGDLTVEKNAELAIVTDDDAALVISGDVYIAEDGAFDFDGALISGGVFVEGALRINGDVLLLGTISIDASEGSTATANIDGNIVVGASDIGAAAGISGPVTLEDDKFIAVFPGAEVREDTVKNMKVSGFYLNDVLYVTAYATGANVAAIAENGVINAVVPIAGYDMSGMYPAGADKFVNWTDGLGTPITAATNKIGSVVLFCFDGAQKTADVLVSVATGMSIYVDGVKYASGTTIEGVSMGAHTVMVTVNPGYKYADGTGPTVTFDGKVLSGILAFTITTDMADKTVVLSAIGDIVVDQPDIPEQEKEDNSMIMILLGVLVVMVVILAIVTVIRMMRS